MTAPDKIWASKTSTVYMDGSAPLTASTREFRNSVEYTRTASIPAPGDDYVAGLEAAARAALNFITNTESELGIILGCGDSLRAAISARPTTEKEGVCCCGDDMAGHAEPMDCGHVAVDIADRPTETRVVTKSVCSRCGGDCGQC